MSFDLEICGSGSRRFESVEDVADVISYAFDGNTSDSILSIMEGVLPDIQGAGFNLFRIGSSLGDTDSNTEVLYIEEAANEDNRIYVHVLLENPFRVTKVTREAPEMKVEKVTETV
jgi:hypothetical protein